MFTDYEISGEVTEGRLEISDRPAFSRAMRHFKSGPVVVRVRRDTGTRTSQANRYYRLVLGLIADETGDDPDYLHDFFKHKFLEPEVVAVLGEEIEIYTSVKDPERFHSYVEDIRRFVLMPPLSIETPDPDPAMRGKSRKAKRKEGKS